LIVENLRIINKTKHSTKGRERKGYKMEGPNQVLAKTKYITNEVLYKQRIGDKSSTQQSLPLKLQEANQTRRGEE